MSESKLETVSLLVDNYQADNKAFDDIVNDAEMSDTWDRYHMIGDVIRDDIPNSLNFDLSAQIAETIAEEPTVLAPQRSSIGEKVKAKVIAFTKPFGQVAIAASAAGLMIFGVQQNVSQTESLVPTQVVQTVPFGGVAQPVSLNYQSNERLSQQQSQKQAIVEQQRRFHALLQDHKQQIKFTSAVRAEANAEKGEESAK